MMTVNGIEYEMISLLGHGKGGYSYLVKRYGLYYVLKQIHHEPCDYYAFGNKVQSEYDDYHKLLRTGIRMPKMIDIDFDQERILKEYIEGETIAQIIEKGGTSQKYLDQIISMGEKAFKAGLNIDYYPTNFVVRNDLLYYIDYECNEYMEQWNFDNWGRQYWK